MGEEEENISMCQVVAEDKGTASDAPSELLHSDALKDAFKAGCDWERLMANAWQPMSMAPKDKYILVYDARLLRSVVCMSMTAIEDGSVDFVYARQVGANGFAFICTQPTHWMKLPSPPPSNEVGQRPSDESHHDGRQPDTKDKP